MSELNEQRRLVRIEAEGQQINRPVKRVLGEFFLVTDRGQSVEVRDEVERAVVALFLKSDVLLDRAEVVAPVERAGGLDAGECTHGGVGRRLEAGGCRKGNKIRFGPRALPWAVIGRPFRPMELLRLLEGADDLRKACCTQ